MTGQRTPGRLGAQDPPPALDARRTPHAASRTHLETPMTTPKQPPRPDTPLNLREARVIAGLARGHTLARVAADLGVTRGAAQQYAFHAHIRLRTSYPASTVHRAYLTGALADLPPEPRPPITLTSDERALLSDLAAGMTNPRLADARGLPHSSIARHLTRLYRKIGARTRAHAVALAHQHRLFADQQES